MSEVMRLIVLILLMVVCAEGFAQTTFILVRHAEKENVPAGDQMMAKDPPLSQAGKERALALSKLLEKQKVAAIYSTNYTRTRDTVKPLADAKGIQIQLYEPVKEPDLGKLIEAGGTVLICGHSNTIPALANALVGQKEFANYDDSDYGNILIITATSVGKATVTHLRY